MKNKKQLVRIKRRKRIRLRIFGTDERPRLIVRRSSRHLGAQVINDVKNTTLLSLSTFDKEVKEAGGRHGNIKEAVSFGEAFAKKAKEKGISKIVFDRAGYLYHGRIKAFAEALKKAGLEF